MVEDAPVFQTRDDIEEHYIEEAMRAYWQVKSKEERERIAARAFALFRERATVLEHRIRTREVLCVVLLLTTALFATLFLARNL